MDRSEEAGQIVHYENPPVVEVILGVQLERLPGFGNAFLGSFWQTLDNEQWSNVSDAPLLEPQFERFAESGNWAGIGTHLKLTQDPSCRLQIRNKDGDRMIQVQNGRFQFNWLGQGGADYPRYHSVREGFACALGKYRDFLAQSELGALQPNQWEVTYLNHIPRGTVWNTPNDWAFFRPLVAMPTVDGVAEGESFTGGWHFVIPGQRGRLHVEWRHALGPAPTQQELIVLTLTARGPLEKDSDDIQTILDGLDLGRRTIVCAFKELISDSANDYWGLNHVSG